MKDIQIIASNPELRDYVEMKANVVYAAPDGEALAMQIVRPMWKPEGAGFPLVVFIQGSAWTKPDQFEQIPQLVQLARRGYVVASVTHRSCFAAKAPAFLVDVKAAIRFLRAHAEEYGIDKRRVCAWGTSSGGNTALLLGMTGDDPAYDSGDWPGESSAVQVVVDCFGPTDVNRMLTVQFKDIPREEKQLLFALGGADTEEGCREALDRISPIRYVEPGRAFPPFLILHGDADEMVRFEDSRELYDRLIACGHEAEFVRVTGAPHEGPFWSAELLEIIFDFIGKRLG
ncbi:MAG: alpha/beta hydrolase [Clostridia bacterium]|nr:alpha/beta hydrolase [Clostridia bacterium]